jgi:hypothetical protein
LYLNVFSILAPFFGVARLPRLKVWACPRSIGQSR